MNNKTGKKFQFGKKEIILSAVLALIVIIFVIVFTGNTATVKFVSVGGSFDSGSGATVYDYGYYVEGSTDATLSNYYEVLSKSYRISSVATLPEAKRTGYRFVGWYYGEVDAEGKVTYKEEFTEKSVKNLDKDSEATVYAKWAIEDGNKTTNKKASIIAALNITWKGMLGIFLVITIIFVCIVLLNTLTKLSQKRKSAKKTSEGTDTQASTKSENTEEEKK